MQAACILSAVLALMTISVSVLSLLSTVQCTFVCQGKVVVGHALHNDLSVLGMEDFVPPGMRRDTSQCFQLRELAGLAHRPVASLRALALAILG